MATTNKYKHSKKYKAYKSKKKLNVIFGIAMLGLPVAAIGAGMGIQTKVRGKHASAFQEAGYKIIEAAHDREPFVLEKDGEEFRGSANGGLFSAPVLKVWKP